MMWFVLLFVVAPLVELYVIIQVASVIGGWQTIALLVAESMVGAWLLKRQGGHVLAKIAEALDAGRIPGRELVDGFLLMVAGSLMLAPGFITDLIAYLLVIPPTRAVARRILQKRFEAGTYGRFFATAGTAGGAGAVGGAGGGGGGGAARFVGTFRAGPVMSTGPVMDTTGHPGSPTSTPTSTPTPTPTPGRPEADS